MSEDAETPLSAGSEDPNDSIERIGRKKRRLDYTEYSQDEEEEKMKTNGRTKKVKHIERKARPKQGTMGPSR
uniref:Uncharacterized protein n=1 Tax=Caenorhabditis japonica TaxID=281687 RepID=A0A8R1ERN1_CAEJA